MFRGIISVLSAETRTAGKVMFDGKKGVWGSTFLWNFRESWGSTIAGLRCSAKVDARRLSSAE